MIHDLWYKWTEREGGEHDYGPTEKIWECEFLAAPLAKVSERVCVIPPVLCLMTFFQACAELGNQQL